MTLLEIFREQLQDKTILGKIFIGIPLIIFTLLSLPIILLAVFISNRMVKIKLPNFIKIKNLFYNK